MDFLAGLLGMKKVGWIFTQSKQERDFIMHTVREQPQRLWAVFLYETAQGGNHPPPHCGILLRGNCFRQQQCKMRSGRHVQL